MMIQLQAVIKSFPGVFQPVLNNITMSFKPGEFTVVIGANGSGKSTLMKMISGEYRPDVGRVSVSAPVAQVVQDVHKGTVPQMTLLENMALSYIKKPQFSFYRRYQADVISIIKQLGLGLEAYLDLPLGQLSGGQRQIIATVMAIHSGRAIVLLDEHTSALDPKMQALLMRYTADAITQQHITALMITHNMNDAIAFGDRLIMLHQGRIVLDVQGQDKRALSVSALLALFHHYEDEDLLAEVSYVD